MTNDWPLEAERELWADICTPGRHEHSLWWFVKIAAGWHFKCNERGQLNWLTERVHLPWLDWMQARVEEWYARRCEPNHEPERMQVCICVPRGFGKSNIITKIIPLWEHLREPDLTSVIGSEVHPMAKAFLGPIQRILEGDDHSAWFAWLYGNYRSADRTWNLSECTTAARQNTAVSEPTIGTFGAETGITGKHPLVCIYDDPISYEKLKDSTVWLNTVLESFDSIYPAVREDGLFILIGTRYLDDDPIGSSLGSEGVASWAGHDPLEPYSQDGAFHVYFLQARDIHNTSRYEEGEPVLPEAGWTHEALKRYANKNAAKHAAQMMNDPFHGEHIELTNAQIDMLIIPRPARIEDRIPVEYAVVFLDTAFKDEERRGKGDFNVIAIVLYDLRDNGIVYIDYIWRDRKARAEHFDAKLIGVLASLRARGIRVRAISDEAEQGGKRGVYKQHLEQIIEGAGLPIPEIYQFNRSGSRKPIRIREAAQYWLDNCVRIYADCGNIDALKYEMTRIGTARKDDVSDALADAFRPEFYRRRHGTYAEQQPPFPVQPGDEVLKATMRFRQQIADQMARTARGYSIESVDEDEYHSRGPWQ